MTAPRSTARHLVKLSSLLSDSDVVVLTSIGGLRLATTGQIERLHFADHATPAAGARAARRTLARLHALRLVARLDRRVGGVRAGSSGFVWSLAPAGQRLVTKAGPAGGAAIRKPWTPSLAFVAHRLGITELAVELAEAERRGTLAVAQFVAEPTCWRSYIGSGGARSWLKPDAHVVMSDGEYEDSWFIEIDQGTESPTAICWRPDFVVM